MKQVKDLTNKVQIESESTTPAILKLRKEMDQMKHEHMKLLNETRAMNKTINYTTGDTVGRVLHELNIVKVHQRDIEKTLQALSHLNDTEEDHLNLRGEVALLATQVSRNVTDIEENLKNSRLEWMDVVNKRSSAMNKKIADLANRLERFEKMENGTDSNSKTNGGLRSSVSAVFVTLCFLTTQVSRRSLKMN